jgi:hypothetical protein
MVVVDDTPECARAVHFAARRASRTGASMVMLAVVDPPDNFEWIGVGEAMIAEAQEEAEKRLEEAAKEARAAAGLDPEQVIRVGEKSASGTGKEGPGPLVSSIAGKAASTFPIPIVIVPGSLSDDEIDALAG